MDEVCKLAARDYLDGLLTQKEFLARLMDGIGRKWQEIGPISNDAEITNLASQLRKA